MKIYKYLIPMLDYYFLPLPKDAEIISVQLQSGRIYMWALVQPDAQLEARTFRLVGTGHELSEPQENLKFLGTAQLDGGELVFHLFEIINKTVRNAG